MKLVRMIAWNMGIAYAETSWPRVEGLLLFVSGGPRVCCVSQLFLSKLFSGPVSS